MGMNPLRIDKPGGQGLGPGSVNGQWLELKRKLEALVAKERARAEAAEGQVRELLARLQEVKNG